MRRVTAVCAALTLTFSACEPKPSGSTASFSTQISAASSGLISLEKIGSILLSASKVNQILNGDHTTFKEQNPLATKPGPANPDISVQPPACSVAYSSNSENFLGEDTEGFRELGFPGNTPYLGQYINQSIALYPDKKSTFAAYDRISRDLIECGNTIGLLSFKNQPLSTQTKISISIGERIDTSIKWTVHLFANAGQGSRSICVAFVARNALIQIRLSNLSDKYLDTMVAEILRNL